MVIIFRLILLIIVISIQTIAVNQRVDAKSMLVKVAPEESSSYTDNLIRQLHSIEISYRTLDEMWHENDKLASNIIKNIATLLKKKKLSSCGFLYDLNKYRNEEQQDCILYEMDEYHNIDYDKIVKKSFVFDCINDIPLFVKRIVAILKKRKVAKTSALESYLSYGLAKKPVVPSKRDFDLDLLLAALIEIEKKREGEIGYLSTKFRNSIVTIPVINHEVQPGETLWGIAGKTIKNSYDWQVLWFMNFAKISDPHKIKPGTLISIPSPIIGWEPIAKSMTGNPSDVSVWAYGNKELGGVVTRAMEIGNCTDDDSECFIPKFAIMDRFMKVYIGEIH